nr:hypothetical protein [Tanacetum cinerariifolium]
MGDENPIHTLVGYSRPSYKGYRNTIELLAGKNVEGQQNSAMISLCFNNIKENHSQKHGLDSRTYSRKSLIMELIFSSKSKFFMTMSLLPHDERSISRLVVTFVTKTPTKPGETWALLEDLTLYDNKSWNDPIDYAKPVKEIYLPQDVPSTFDCRIIELKNQVQCLMEAHLAHSQPVQVNKIYSLCKICNGPHDTQYCMENPKQAFVDYASSRTDKVGGEAQKEWNKKPVKATLPKYLSPESIKELNKNLSAPKRVHFVNSIIILSKAKEEGTAATVTPEHNHNITKEAQDEEKEDLEDEESEVEAKKEVKEMIEYGRKYESDKGEGKEIKYEESEMETDEEVEEVFEVKTDEEEDEDMEHFNSFPTMDELVYHEWLLKNPRPHWVKAKIMTYGLGTKQKPSNPNKNSNFIGRVKGLKVFIGGFAYKYDFMILEDTTRIIDDRLGEFVFGRPFIDEIGLVHNKEEGTIAFNKDDERITFEMPHTLEIFKQTRLQGLRTNLIPSATYEDNYGHGRIHYCQSLLLGDEYMQDTSNKRGIRHLMKLEREMMKGQEKVTYGV